MTTTTVDKFGGDGVKFETVNEILARRIIGDGPLKGDLPLRPSNIYLQKGNASTEANARLTLAKPRVRPAADVAERPTGAAIRKVGLPLDGELRRSRVFGGRESKSMTPDNSFKDDAPESRPTGAVTRPPKTVISDSVDPSGKIERGDRRTDPTDGSGVIKREQDFKGRPERSNPDIVTPAKPSKSNDDVERPAKTVRPQPEERVDTPAPRREPPVRKYEPPQRSEPAPRYEPPQRSEPAPRYEPPQRSEPVRKSEPPPQRSEPTQKSAPAPKSDPPAQKSEPAKVQSGKSNPKPVP